MSDVRDPERLITDSGSQRRGRRLCLALVGPLPPPEGGIANQTRQLAEFFSEQGIQVDLVRTNSPYRPAFLASVRGLRAFARLLPYMFRLWVVAGRANVLHVMANSGWSWHLFAAPAIWIARVRGTPVVVNYRGGGARRFLEAQHRWVIPSLRRADVLAVPSGFLREVFEQFGISAQIVPNAVDSRRFYPGNGHTKTITEELNLVIARNLEPIYDVATGIQAFAQIVKSAPGARLQIAGDGPERAALEAKVVELGISDRVEFLGRVSGSRVAELYRKAYLVLNPTRVDNMPNSIIEALATGVPVVTTNVGGIPFIVDEGQTALLVEPGDPTAMAQASLRLIKDSALWDHISACALRSAKAYSWERVRDQWLEIYRALTGQRWDREQDQRAMGSRG